MARNKKPRKKKYDPTKAQNTIKGAQQVDFSTRKSPTDSRARNTTICLKEK